jgi:hypothetical protein
MASIRRILNMFLHPLSRPPKNSHFPVIKKTEVFMKRASIGSVGHLYQSHEGRPSSKWSHYLDVYDYHFEPIRKRTFDQGVRLIEIGVAEGGSLEVWQRYFGPKSQIVGIDIQPQVTGSLGTTITLVTGSQSDSKVVDEACSVLGGAVDVVIDDGSHRGRDQIRTFEMLWSRLSEGAVYVVEDLHTSYWAEFEGGPGRRGTFIEYAKLLVDDIHLTYHRRPRTKMGHVAARSIESIAFYDSMVVLTKGSRTNPSRVDFGQR